MDDPKQLVARGYDRIATRYAAWPGAAWEGDRARYGALLFERLPAGAAVLDLGCGPGIPATRELAKRFAVTGVDVSGRFIELARQHVPNATFLQSDMAALDFPPGSFDAVVAFYSIIHLPREEHAPLLRAIVTWLRPGGLLITTMGASATDAGYEEGWLGVPMYWSHFDSAANRNLVADAGFDVLEANESATDEDGVPVMFCWIVAQKPAGDGAEGGQLVSKARSSGNKMDEYPERLQYLTVNGCKIAAALHESSEKRLVIFCHGFRGDKLGPSRIFVRLARQLQPMGICSLRFDQVGSGESEGDFHDSSFVDWVSTTTELARRFIEDGYQVSLLGQSMGGTAALIAAADLGAQLASVVAWVPDPSIDPPVPQGQFMEEGGQRVRWRYWNEAHAAKTADRFRQIQAPTLVFFATNDAYVSSENRKAIIAGWQPHQRIELLEGHTHSDWTYDQVERVMAETSAFLLLSFGS